MVSLRCRGEGNFYFGAEDLFEHECLDHFIVASGVKNAESTIGKGGFAELDELLECDGCDILGKVMIS